MHSLPEHYIVVCIKNHAPAVLSHGMKTRDSCTHWILLKFWSKK